MEVSPEILLDDCEVKNNTQFKSVGETSEEMDPFCDVDSDITDVEADSDGEIFNTTQQMLNDYFPFPSEIFFLLYSYAHNISRPKVFL